MRDFLDSYTAAEAAGFEDDPRCACPACGEGDHYVEELGHVADAMRIGLADARALWAFRVHVAWARNNGHAEVPVFDDEGAMARSAAGAWASLSAGTRAELGPQP